MRDMVEPSETFLWCQKERVRKCGSKRTLADTFRPAEKDARREVLTAAFDVVEDTHDVLLKEDGTEAIHVVAECLGEAVSKAFRLGIA
jgi:hypothetical protein